MTPTIQDLVDKAIMTILFDDNMQASIMRKRITESPKPIPLDEAEQFIESLGDPYCVDDGLFWGGRRVMLYEHPEDPSMHVRVELEPDGTILECETWSVVRGNLR